MPFSIKSKKPSKYHGVFVFKLAKVCTKTCARCRKEKTSKTFIATDESLEDSICNGCYGEALAKNQQWNLWGE